MTRRQTVLTQDEYNRRMMQLNPHWEVAYERTSKKWMIWRDGSPAIAYCYVEKDADKPENTTRRVKQDPAAALGGMLIEGTSGFIENMERAGGRQMLESEVLPTEILGGTTEDFTALGFAFHGIVTDDPIFQQATLPAGWKREAGENPYGYWTNLVDERGVARVAIFYKAAFYDRHAHMRLVNVGHSIASEAIYDATKEIPWGVLKQAEVKDAVAGLHEYMDSVKRNPAIYGAREARTRELIASYKAGSTK